MPENWDPAEYERAARLAAAVVADYVRASQAGEGPAVNAPPPAQMADELELRRLIREGGLDVDRFGRRSGRARAPSARTRSSAAWPCSGSASERALVELEVDELERIVPERLEVALERAQERGLPPMALVAASCATSTGLHDDLEAVGQFCERHGIWFHVDGAHGASALLSSRHRDLIRGIERADSVVWDAHKMLRTSSVCAAVLVRDVALLDAAFQQRASYLIYEDAADSGPDLLGRQVECTKSPLGLKVFLNLAWRGERSLGDYVAGQYDKTLRFWELIEARRGFECLSRPESNISASATGAIPPSRSRCASGCWRRGASTSARPRSTGSAGCAWR